MHVLHECFVASFHVRSRPRQKGGLFLVEHQFGTRVFIAVAGLCVTDSKYTPVPVFEEMNNCVKKFRCFWMFQLSSAGTAQVRSHTGARAAAFLHFKG